MTAYATDPTEVASEMEALLRDVEAGRPPAGGFHHADHVHLAWLYLKREPRERAIPRFCRTLRRFAAAQGAAEKYHETITLAYLLLVGERMARGGPDESFAGFAARNRDLLEWRPSILERYYRPETLRSPLAREVFVLPDAGLPRPSAPGGA